MVKVTNADIDERLRERGIRRVGEYKGMNTPTEFLCLKESCGYLWTVQTRSITQNGNGCPKCGRVVAAGKLSWTNEEIDRELIRRETNITRVDSYLGARTKINFQCNECIHVWLATPDNILRGKGCPKCSNHIQLTNADVDRRLLGRKIKRLGEYLNNSTKIDFQCEGCSYVWSAAPNKIFQERGCPNCSFGKNEGLAYETLQKSFPDIRRHQVLKGLGPTSKKIIVDFYLPSASTIVEYNGKQHYSPVKFGGISQPEADIAFTKQRERDLYLEDWCVQNNIKLVWIDGRRYIDSKLVRFIEDELLAHIEGQE